MEKYNNPSHLHMRQLLWKNHRYTYATLFSQISSQPPSFQNRNKRPFSMDPKALAGAAHLWPTSWQQNQPKHLQPHGRDWGTWASTKSIKGWKGQEFGLFFRAMPMVRAKLYGLAFWSIYYRNNFSKSLNR